MEYSVNPHEESDGDDAQEGSQVDPAGHGRCRGKTEAQGRQPIAATIYAMGKPQCQNAKEIGGSIHGGEVRELYG